MLLGDIFHGGKPRHYILSKEPSLVGGRSLAKQKHSHRAFLPMTDDQMAADLLIAGLSLTRQAVVREGDHLSL
jgi:hypothetical protein